MRGVWFGLGALIVGVVVASLVVALRASSPPADPDERPTPVERAAVVSRPAGSGDDTAAYHASQLVVEAGREVSAGRYPQARALLDQAYALDPQPATLLQLARVEDQLGRCREARRAAQRVIAASPDAVTSDQAGQLLSRLGRCD